MEIRSIIFDLDGVIVSTDHYHYLAWKQIADEEGIEFNKEINHRLRGVSRMESLDIVLERAGRSYSQQEKHQLAERKNDTYKELLTSLTASDLLPEVQETLDALRSKGLKLAIGSSSKNAPFILDKIGLGGFFDAIADGNHIRNSKPDPEVFLLAANKIGELPEHCLVVEDAEAGVEAGLRAGMAVAAVGDARNGGRAHVNLDSMGQLVSVISAGLRGR